MRLNAVRWNDAISHAEYKCKKARTLKMSVQNETQSPSQVVICPLWLEMKDSGDDYSQDIRRVESDGVRTKMWWLPTRRGERETRLARFLEMGLSTEKGKRRPYAGYQKMVKYKNIDKRDDGNGGGRGRSPGDGLGSSLRQSGERQVAPESYQMRFAVYLRHRLSFFFSFD